MGKIQLHHSEYRFPKNTNNKTLSKWYGWDLMYPTYTTKLNIPSGIKMVQIDPSNRLADVNMMNNYKRRGLAIAPESSILKLENYVYNPPTWKNTMQPFVLIFGGMQLMA